MKNNAAPSAFLRFPQVCRRVGLSRSTVLRLQAAGLFPRSYRISKNALAFSSDEVEEWMAQRLSAKELAEAYLRGDQRGGGR